jgi:translation initiation factor IF-2
MDGSIFRTDRARIIRGGRSIFEGKISTLRRFKDDVREVEAGTECGIALEGFYTYAEGDTIESFGQEEVSRAV